MAKVFVKGEIEAGGGYGEQEGDVESAPQAAESVGLDYFSGSIKGGGDVMSVGTQGLGNGVDMGLESDFDNVKGGDDGGDEGGAKGG